MAAVHPAIALCSASQSPSVDDLPWGQRGVQARPFKSHMANRGTVLENSARWFRVFWGWVQHCFSHAFSSWTKSKSINKDRNLLMNLLIKEIFPQVGYLSRTIMYQESNLGQFPDSNLYAPLFTPSLLHELRSFNKCHVFSDPLGSMWHKPQAFSFLFRVPHLDYHEQVMHFNFNPESPSFVQGLHSKQGTEALSSMDLQAYWGVR